jgi:hypothetical protein
MRGHIIQNTVFLFGLLCISKNVLAYDFKADLAWTAEQKASLDKVSLLLHKSNAILFYSLHKNEVRFSFNQYKEAASDEIRSLPSFLQNDLYLLRFLAAKKFDVGRSIEMLRQALKWRKDMKLDTNEDFTDFDQLYPGSDGKDKDGLPSELAKNVFRIDL